MKSWDPIGTTLTVANAVVVWIVVVIFHDQLTTDQRVVGYSAAAIITIAIAVYEVAKWFGTRLFHHLYRADQIERQDPYGHERVEAHDEEAKQFKWWAIALCAVALVFLLIAWLLTRLLLLL